MQTTFEFVHVSGIRIIVNNIEIRKTERSLLGVKGLVLAFKLSEVFVIIIQTIRHENYGQISLGTFDKQTAFRYNCNILIYSHKTITKKWKYEDHFSKQFDENKNQKKFIS